MKVLIQTDLHLVTPKPENGVRIQATLQSEPHRLARGSSQNLDLIFW